MFVNAATGSPKNMVPKRLIATSNRRVEVVGLGVALDEADVVETGSGGAVPGDVEHGFGQVDAGGRPVGADRVGGGQGGHATTAADVEDGLRRR